MWYYFYSEIFQDPSELSADFKQAMEWCQRNTTRTFSLVSLSLRSYSQTKKVNLYDTSADDCISEKTIEWRKSGSYTLRCKFRSKRDAALFKLFFHDIFPLRKCPKLADYTKVILPIIRRVMPTIIANEREQIQHISFSMQQ